MIVFPNCKINLGLRILDKRADGFHNIESIFFPVPVHDALEIIESKELTFRSEGRKIPGNATDNICLKAWHLLKQKFEIPPVNIFLYKNIPIGAGLGGGSSDGAFALKLLNEKFDLKLSANDLKVFASQLGSDCPFFIDNKEAYVTGRGEVMNEIPSSLKGYYLLLLYPDIEINTAWAYKELSNFSVVSKVVQSNPTHSLTEIAKQPVNTWRENLTNDFEKVIFPHYPLLKQLKQQLYDGGAVYASMTGSGACLFGVFESDKNIKTINNSLTMTFPTFIVKVD